jgi:hypothetical protein
MTFSIKCGRYIKYGLQTNPFPGNPDATSLLDIIEKGMDEHFPLAPSIHSYVQQMLRTLTRRTLNENIGLIIGGDWGLGKTHLLLSFVKMIKEELRSALLDYNVKLIYISPTPILSLKEVYGIIISELRRKYGISVDYTDSKQGFEEVLRSKLSSKDLLVILLDQLEQGVKESEITDWFQIAKGVAYNIDEVIRVIDKNRKFGVALAVAVYPQLYSELVKILPAPLYHRFELTPLTTQEEAKDLIISYLNTARLIREELAKCISDPREINILLDRIKQSNGLYPFTEKAIHELYLFGNATPRNILKLAFYSLEYATSQGIDFIDDVIVHKANPDTKDLATYIKATDTLLSSTPMAITHTISKVIWNIIARAIYIGMLGRYMLLPQKLEPDVARRLYGDKIRISKPYELDPNCMLLASTDFKHFTMICTSTRISRLISDDDVKKYIEIISLLGSSGLQIDNFILIGLTKLDDKAWGYISAFKARNVNFKHLYLNSDARDDLGKLLCYGVSLLQETKGLGKTITELINICRETFGRIGEREESIAKEILENVLGLSKFLAT